ncbi:MAG TPA: hypothetical protein VFE33_29680 [Thermoanaerobaculia bacterium]|nr:hypothetical protein [Thermoanaerobaculia bacterium]
MSKTSMLMGGLAMMCTTLVAAAPQATPPQPPTPVTSSSQPLPWEDPPSGQVCNLLCIIGDHCCIIHGKATCIPNDQACP